MAETTITVDANKIAAADLAAISVFPDIPLPLSLAIGYVCSHRAADTCWAIRPVV
jgi:hypothetical protein